MLNSIETIRQMPSRPSPSVEPFASTLVFGCFRAIDLVVYFEDLEPLLGNYGPVLSHLSRILVPGHAQHMNRFLDPCLQSGGKSPGLSSVCDCGYGLAIHNSGLTTEFHSPKWINRSLAMVWAPTYDNPRYRSLGYCQTWEIHWIFTLPRGALFLPVPVRRHTF